MDTLIALWHLALTFDPVSTGAGSAAGFAAGYITYWVRSK